MTKEICKIGDDIKEIFNKEHIIVDNETMEHVINILDKVMHYENK